MYLVWITQPFYTRSRLLQNPDSIPSKGFPQSIAASVARGIFAARDFASFLTKSSRFQVDHRSDASAHVLDRVFRHLDRVLGESEHIAADSTMNLSEIMEFSLSAKSVPNRAMQSSF